MSCNERSLNKKKKEDNLQYNYKRNVDLIDQNG